MIYTGNRVPVVSSYKPEATFELPRDGYALKLTIRVREVPVILEVSERTERYFARTADSQILLEAGTHSRSFVTPITAWRFKTEGASPTTVDFTAYA